MSEDISVQTFEPLLEKEFQLSVSETQSIPLKLVKIKRFKEVDTSQIISKVKVRKNPFSLLFLGPPDNILPQRIYRLDTDNSTTFELFLVPIGEDNVGVYYESSFS